MKKIILFIFVFIHAVFVFAQKPAFYDDIQKFKHTDSIAFPPHNAILFVGSSSFTKWTDLQNYFPTYTLINRGFGGSRLLDVITYADDIIFPYHPKQIVIYCGENDLAYSDTVSAQTVANRFTTLFDIVRSVWDTIPIAFISLKPSPSREYLLPKMRETNLRIKNFLAAKKNTAFIDVYSKMLTSTGDFMHEIYVEDNLHMNAKGYAIWQKEIEPYLIK